MLKPCFSSLLACWILSLAAAAPAAQDKQADDAKGAEGAKAKKPYDVELKSDVIYGKAADEELKLDLATPQGIAAALPGLVFIHGGGWSGGKKEGFTALARRAAEAGFVAVSIDYRLAPKHLFPAQIEDCKCAVRWMRAHAAELKVDPTRIGAIGGSAGAHLAMMLGTMDAADGLEGDGGWPDQSSKVQAVVSYVGPTNLIGDFPAVSQGILKTFLGGTVDEQRERYQQASPITYVNAGDPPMLLFAGTKDELVPGDQAVQMATALTAAGVPGRVELLLGAGHGFPPKESERTLREAMDFFADALAPAEAGEKKP